MTIHTVTYNSPPRYFILGADSDEEIEELSFETTQELAKKVLESIQEGNKDHKLFLHIPFQHNHRIQEISHIDSYYIKEGKLVCEYTIPESHPCFFSAGYKKRWSRITAYYKGSENNNQHTPIKNHTTYLPCKEPYHFCSTNLHAYIQLAPLTDSMRETLGLPPSTIRRNLFASDETISKTIYEEKIEIGQLLAIKKILIKIPLPESEDPDCHQNSV